MPQERFSLETRKKEIRDSFDEVFFAPLEKLRQKWEATDLDASILFTPLTKLKDRISSRPASSHQKINDDDFINSESAIGRTIFGVIPAGHQREFFRDKHNIWIYHESWEELGEEKHMTIRYEVREDGVYKKYEGSGYVKIEGLELENFSNALRTYLKLCKEQLYGV